MPIGILWTKEYIIVDDFETELPLWKFQETDQKLSFAICFACLNFYFSILQFVGFVLMIATKKQRVIFPEKLWLNK